MRRLFKVCAADKVTRMDALNGASLVAKTTSCAFGIIDDGKIVFNLDRSVRAGLFALTASDTAVKTNLTHLSALVVA